MRARRRAESAHAHVHDHQDCCRRQSAVYATTMDNLNDGLGRIGELTRDTAGATHSLSCGTTDRDCDEAKYLQEALDLSRRGQKVTLVERSSSSRGCKATMLREEDETTLKGLSGDRSLF